MYLRKLIVTLAFIVALSISQVTTVMAADYSLSDQQKSYVMKYIQVAIEESVGHNIPWQIAMAQGILESGSGTTPNAVNNHNHHGITDGKGGYKHFDSDYEGWEGYFDNIENTKVYTKNGIHEAVDPIDYLRVLQQSGYAEDPLYEEKIQKIYTAIENYRIEMGLPTTEEYADKIEDDALLSWNLKEQQLVKNELERLYQSETKQQIDNTVLPGKAGIRNTEGILLSESYKLFVQNRDSDLATITSREIYDIG